jgi:hypothetical protein
MSTSVGGGRAGSVTGGQSPIEVVLARVEEVTNRAPRPSGDNWSALCPAHDDTTPSLSVKVGRDDAVLLHCHSGCDVGAVLTALNLATRDLFPAAAKTPDVRAHQTSGRSPQRKREVAVYRYVDENGVLLFEQVRYEPKDFRLRRPDPKAKDGYAWGLGDVRRVLFNLPDLAAAVQAGTPVFLVEGEKDVAAVQTAGGVATCNPMGANNWDGGYAETLRGARVTIVVDRDPAGQTWAQQVYDSLLGVAASIRTVEAAAGKDAHDHLAAGHSLENFRTADIDRGPRRCTRPDCATELGEEVPPGQIWCDSCETGCCLHCGRPKSKAGKKKQFCSETCKAEHTRGGGCSAPCRDPKQGIPRRASVPPEGQVEVPGSKGWTYDTNGVYDRDTLVLGWAPVVVEKLTVRGDNGGVADRFFTIGVGDEEVTVSYSNLQSGEIWSRLPAAVGTGARQVRDVLTNVVLAQTVGMDITQVTTRTGWHNGVYVRADGRTTPPDADLRIVGVPEQLAAAARPPAVVPNDEEIRRALQVVAGAAPVSFAPLLNLGATARSLGYSLVPAPTSIINVGPPNRGKTSSAATGRLLLLTDDGWPPTITAQFADTPTAIELAIDRESDMSSLVDDLALQGDATEADRREAQTKLDRLIRTAANQTSMRGRATRELEQRPGNHVRGIPILTAETLPPKTPESLLRRCVIIGLGQRHDPVDVDIGVLADQWPALGQAGRIIGDRIIEQFADGVASGETHELIRELDRRWTSRLADLIDDGTGSSDGLARNGGYLLAGLELVALAADLDVEEFVTPALAPLGRHLSAQVDMMRNRYDAAGNPAEAIGEVVRGALLDRRAHIADSDGRDVPCVPAQTPQAQGLRKTGSNPGMYTEFEGQGVTVYWLPDHGPALGIRSGELHALANKDARLAGYTTRTLPPALLRAEAIIPNAQRGPNATTQVRCDTGKDNARLVLLRPELVFADLNIAESEDYNGQNTAWLSLMQSWGRCSTSPSERSATAEYVQVNGLNGANRPHGDGAGCTSEKPLTRAVTLLFDDSALNAAKQASDQGGNTCNTCNTSKTVLRVEGDAARAPCGEAPADVALCERCGTVMTFTEPGQRFHPTCDPDPDGPHRPPSDPAGGAGAPCAVCTAPGAWCGRGQGPGTVATAEPCVLCGRPTRMRSLCGAARCAHLDEPAAETAAEIAAEPSAAAAGTPYPAGPGKTVSGPPGRHGVHAADGLHLSDGQVIRDVPAPKHVGDSFDLAAAYDLTGLVLHPNLGLPIPDEWPPAVDPREGIDHAFITDATATHEMHREPAKLLARVGGRRRSDEYLPKVWVTFAAYDVSTHIRDAPDGAALLATLTAFIGAVGVPYRHSPQATGRALVEQLHPRKHGGKQLTPRVTPPVNIPANAETALAAARPLTDAENTCRYAHGFDLNLAYLAALSSVSLGHGTPEHRTGGVDFDAKLPGYWFCQLDPPGAPWPNPFGPTRGGEPGPAWHATPTVALAVENGQTPAITEALVWPERDRYLRPMYERLSKARGQLLADPSPGAAGAYGLVKDVVHTFPGWLARSRRDDLVEWYRPEWAHAIIAQARTNFYRKLRKLGAAPYLVDTDAAYYAADEPDPTVFAARVGLVLGGGLGQFKTAGSGLLAPIAKELSRPSHDLLTTARRATDASFTEGL